MSTLSTTNLKNPSSGSNNIVLDSSGRVLVGTSSSESLTGDQYKVQIKGTDASAGLSIHRSQTNTAPTYLALAKSRSGAIVSSGDGLGAINFIGHDGVDLDSIAATIEAQVDGTPGANDMPGRLVFSTTADGASSPTEAMRITSGQNIRIGTTTDGSGYITGRLRLVGNAGALNSFYAEQSVSGGYCYISNAVSNGGNYYHLHFLEAGVPRGSITSQGAYTSYNTTSDYRLKENILPIEGATDRLLSLKPSQFNFIDFPDRILDGFIAHEVQAVVPEAITGEKDAADDDGNPVYQGIDQSKLVPLLTAALQEAVAKIESLEARLTAAGI